MGRNLVPATMLAALTALAVAAGTAAAVPWHPSWWQAALPLAVLGGLVPMIFAVTIRVVPVFARRAWPRPSLLPPQVVLVAVGGWLVWSGHIAGIGGLPPVGHLLALAGGIVAATNSLLLLRQPAGPSMAPPTDATQTAVDQVARPFTRIAGVWLLVGLVVGAVTAFWRPPFGRWDLVWAHALLVGYVLGTATGISYHVLGRWTGRPWPWVAPLRLHLWLWAVGLPVMVIALATGRASLFAVAGTLQAATVLLFLVNIAPMLGGLPTTTRWAFAASAAVLAVGVVLGGAFALDPAVGARLRLAHADLNVFGWAGLLISGAATYLAPRFAGSPLRWPRLALGQIALLATGVAVAAAGTAWHMLGSGPSAAITAGLALVAAAYLLLAAILAGTFFGRRKGASIVLSPGPRPA